MDEAWEGRQEDSQPQREDNTCKRRQHCVMMGDQYFRDEEYSRNEIRGRGSSRRATPGDKCNYCCLSRLVCTSWLSSAHYLCRTLARTHVRTRAFTRACAHDRRASFLTFALLHIRWTRSNTSSLTFTLLLHIRWPSSNTSSLTFTLLYARWPPSKLRPLACRPFVESLFVLLCCVTQRSSLLKLHSGHDSFNVVLMFIASVSVPNQVIGQTQFIAE